MSYSNPEKSNSLTVINFNKIKFQEPLADKFTIFTRKNRIKHIEMDVSNMNLENESDVDNWSSQINQIFSQKQVKLTHL